MSRTLCEVCHKTRPLSLRLQKIVCALCEARVVADKRIEEAQSTLEETRTTQEAIYSVAAILDAMSLIPKELYPLGNHEISIYPTDKKQAGQIAGVFGKLIHPAFKWRATEDRVARDGEMLTGECLMFLSRGMWRGRLLIRAVPKDVTEESVVVPKGATCISCGHNVNAWSGSCSCPCHHAAMRAVKKEN